LTGTIPTEIGRLFKLDHVNFAVNNLSGSIPIALRNCTSLRQLVIRRNKLSGPIPSVLGLMRSLSSLSLSDNSLSGHIPPALGNCTRLLELLLSHNDLSGRIPVELGLLQKLEMLNLSSNKLENTIPLSLGNCSSLQILDLGKLGMPKRLLFTIINFHHRYSLPSHSISFAGACKRRARNLCLLARSLSISMLAF